MQAVDIAELPSQWLGLAVALGCGLLIGLERERRKGQGPTRQPAGIRSFSLAALAGALAQALQQPALVFAGALMIIALATVAYLKSRSDDPGLTTELALFATYLVGVLAVASPALGAACGAGVAALLAARGWLHRVSTQLLSEQEVQDLLLLAALALVVVPLLPARPLPWLGGIQPRSLGLLVVLILALQAIGHVATRWLGPRLGLAASGFFSGFVSSTATVATMGARHRARPDQPAWHASAGVMSGAATWLQALLMSVALAPAAGAALAPSALAGACTALGAGWVLLRLSHTSATADASDDVRPLRLREAAIVAAVLAGVAWVVAQAQQHFGTTGLFAGVALAALADAHAPVVSGAALFQAGRVDASTLLACMLLAIGVNTASRCVVAWLSGGFAYAWRVAAGLGSAAVAAGAMGWMTLAAGV
ncbi:MgtC/SapB family protein [Caldimonas caldifontis]|uniref:MgtC/SapB family protein n=1 Tax=Caldimonas caldifontis TaxID=1452508 RepID=UPI001FE3F83D|nr:MgtC/SapB family protein [Caldimonas caldifontis]